MHRSLRIGNNSLDPHSLQALRSGPYEGKIAGLYDLEETLGRGHFAVVKLARHVFTGEKVAVKVIDKSKLDEVSKAHLFQEVRCMKLVQHPNVVRLYEVIDTATKLYLILELGDGGDLYDYIMRHDTGLSEQLAKEYFRQIVRAISYCHQLHVVHRDLKPENVVFFEKLGVVKLTDFGFSNKFCPGQKLETSCGSLAYSAPEILLGDSYDAPAVDVWSLGVILYMLVCGQAPFQEANDSETLTMIMDCKYNVPSHVSKDCRNLISRMLVRNPEKRASLSEIANHQWLSIGKQDNPPLDMLPLVSREHLPEEDHNLIVQKIVNGNIATKEEIQECLDKNEYNHITATYYLLAERKLRSKRQDQVNKSKRPEHLQVPNNSPAPKRENNGTLPTPCLLAVPRTPGDVPQRSRKCSIVQEDEEEEDISSCSGREDSLAPPLNRRGSRSEGRLNLALQERLAELERRKPPPLALPLDHHLGERVPPLVLPHRPAVAPLPPPGKDGGRAGKLPPAPTTNIGNSGGAAKWRMEKSASLAESSTLQAKIADEMKKTGDSITTTIITDSSTISIPIITTSSQVCQTIPKYKTMPSPTRATTLTGSPLQLNEIFEEGDGDSAAGGGRSSASRQFVSRNQQNRTSYEQRRSKFHKARTASCSSSDASDDDSEKRKKRAHKLGSATADTAAKPFQGRRDSHDDSSDSQEPGTGTAGTNNSRVVSNNTIASTTVQNSTGGGGSNSSSHSHKNGSGSGTANGSGTRKNGVPTNMMLGRRHKASRRRNGETRLRESQSLNRITEVQEDNGSAHALVIATSVVGTQSVVAIPKTKSFGARILQGINNTMKKPSDDKPPTHISRKDTVKSADGDTEKPAVDKLDSYKQLLQTVPTSDRTGLRKVKLLGKYFHVHKKLFIPLPGLFSRNNRLYKAQSCGSLARDKITINSETMLRCRQRAVSVIRTSDSGDINQNDPVELQKGAPPSPPSAMVQLNSVCNELTGICAIHLGQASKCCSFC